MVDVTTQQYKGGTEAVLHRDELFENEVSVLVNLSEPHVTDADVQGVVVADAARELFILLHGARWILRKGQDRRWSQREGRLVRCTTTGRVPRC